MEAGGNVRTPARPRRTKRIPVLLYHSVSDRPADSIAPYAIAPAVFDHHLDLITQRHQALTVSQLAECLAGARRLPADPIVITFDDGFADNLEVAAPRLQSRGLPATVYVTTGFLGREAGMLAWEQLDDLEAMHIEIGAHAHNHTPLDQLDKAKAADEIRRSKGMLEDHLRHEVATFAYPHGYTSPRLRGEVRTAGFSSACGVGNAFSHPSDDRWCIARLTVREDTRLERFHQWLDGEGAPVAGRHEALQTRAWRAARRLRHAGFQRVLGK
jgi:peptidoglycan/xylan/chitin deacetylase (PgdA/CDA1 family)